MNTRIETTQKERLLNFLQYLKMGQNAFENSVSIPTGSICHWKNGNIPPKACEKIFNTYPQLNKIWILTGEGEMLISSVVPTGGQPREHRENTDQIVDANKKVLEQIQELAAAQKEAYAAAINEKNDKIQELKYYVELQKDYIDGQKKTIEKLEQFIEHLKAANHELKKAQHTVTVPHAKSV